MHWTLDYSSQAIQCSETGVQCYIELEPGGEGRREGGGKEGRIRQNKWSAHTVSTVGGPHHS